MPLPIVYHPAYEVDIGAHVFPTAKYRLVRERLLAEGVAAEEQFVRPDPAPDAAVARVHTRDYVRKIQSDALSPGQRLALEVPFSAALREASWLCAGGTILTARLALQHGVAVHLGGGYHHAFPDHGEGFCLINDVAIAIRALQHEQLVRRAVVVDCDVHHGNGTAAVFDGDDAVFTLSIHQQDNYPTVKPPSDLDVGLPDGTLDDAYLDCLRHALATMLARTQRVSRGNSDCGIAIYLAGADPYEEDQLGGLALTQSGLGRRDAMVLQTLRDEAVPVAVVLAGGYARRTSDTVSIHCRTVEVASEEQAGG